MMNVDQFISRLPKGHPPHLAADLPVAFGIASNFKSKVAAIHDDKFLSTEGKNAAIVRALRAGPLEHLGQLRRDVTEKLAEAREKRSKLRERVMNAEKFTEGRKQETRQWLRSLDTHERRRVVAEAKDPLILEAVMGAPSFLSGVEPDIWRHVVDTAIQAAHGEALERLDVLERSYAEAAAVLDVAEDLLRRESGLTEDAFAAAAA